MEFIQIEYFKGIRYFETDNKEFTLEVDFNGNIKRVYKKAGFNSKHGFMEYIEINFKDYPPEIKSAKFEKI